MFHTGPSGRHGEVEELTASVDKHAAESAQLADEAAADSKRGPGSPDPGPGSLSLHPPSRSLPTLGGLPTPQVPGIASGRGPDRWISCRGCVFEATPAVGDHPGVPPVSLR